MHRSSLIAIVALAFTCGHAARSADPQPKPAAAQPVETLSVDLGGGVTMKFAKIPAGKFKMGVPEDEPDRDKQDLPVTEVTIAGVLHEYSSIDGVQEDVVDILLNLKQVAIRMHTRDSAELRLSKKGPGPVTAGDIQTDHDVEVVRYAGGNESSEKTMAKTICLCALKAVGELTQVEVEEQ